MDEKTEMLDVVKRKIGDWRADAAMCTSKIDAFAARARNLYDIIVERVVKEKWKRRRERKEAKRIMLFTSWIPTGADLNAEQLEGVVSWVVTSMYLEKTVKYGTFAKGRRKRQGEKVGSTFLYLDKSLAQKRSWTMYAIAEVLYHELQAAVCATYEMLRNAEKWMHVLQKKYRNRIRKMLYVLHMQCMLRKKAGLWKNDTGSCERLCGELLRVMYNNYYIFVKLMQEKKGSCKPRMDEFCFVGDVAECRLTTEHKEKNAHAKDAERFVDILTDAIRAEFKPEQTPNDSEEEENVYALQKVVRGLRVLRDFAFLRLEEYTQLEVYTKRMSIVDYCGNFLLRVPCTFVAKRKDAHGRVRRVKFYVLLSCTPSMLLYRLLSIQRERSVCDRITYVSAIAENLHSLLFVVRYKI